MAKKTINKTSISYPKFGIASTHETDLNKSIAQIEKADVSTLTSKVLQTSKLETLIKHMDFIESASPVLTNIMIASIPVRHSIGNRAKELLNVYYAEHSRCAKRLTELGARNPLNLPVHNKLKKLISADSLELSNSFVTNDFGKIVPCEIHSLNNVKVNDRRLSNVRIFTYKDGANLCIASVINSKFSPKVFDNIKFSKLNDWLKSNNLVA